jgi:hypothetical protein
MVASGQDGEYRMVIEHRYQLMVTYRRWAVQCFRLWVVVAFVRSLWLLSPHMVAPHMADWSGNGMFGVGTAAVVLCWLAAGFGSRREKFGLVMTFNVALFLTVAMVCFRPQAPISSLSQPAALRRLRRL